MYYHNPNLSWIPSLSMVSAACPCLFLHVLLFMLCLCLGSSPVSTSVLLLVGCPMFHLFCVKFLIILSIYPIMSCEVLPTMLCSFDPYFLFQVYFNFPTHFHFIIIDYGSSLFDVTFRSIYTLASCLIHPNVTLLKVIYLMCCWRTDRTFI